jgi:hypothetical protein
MWDLADAMSAAGGTVNCQILGTRHGVLRSCDQVSLVSHVADHMFLVNADLSDRTPKPQIPFPPKYRL